MSRRGPNEGSVYLRKDGRWEGAVHIGYENGQRKRKFVIGKTRAEAVAKLAPLLQARDEHRPIPNQQERLGPFLRRWLDEVPARRCAPRPTAATTTSSAATSSRGSAGSRSRSSPRPRSRRSSTGSLRAASRPDA